MPEHPYLPGRKLDAREHSRQTIMLLRRNTTSLWRRTAIRAASNPFGMEVVERGFIVDLLSAHADGLHLLALILRLRDKYRRRSKNRSRPLSRGRRILSFIGIDHKELVPRVEIMPEVRLLGCSTHASLAIGSR